MTLKPLKTTIELNNITQERGYVNSNKYVAVRGWLMNPFSLWEADRHPREKEESAYQYGVNVLLDKDSAKLLSSAFKQLASAAGLDVSDLRRAGVGTAKHPDEDQFGKGFGFDQNVTILAKKGHAMIVGLPAMKTGDKIYENDPTERNEWLRGRFIANIRNGKNRRFPPKLKVADINADGGFRELDRNSSHDREAFRENFKAGVFIYLSVTPFLNQDYTKLRVGTIWRHDPREDIQPPAFESKITNDDVQDPELPSGEEGEFDSDIPF